MADKMIYDENKLAFTVEKGQLTKGLNKLDESCKEIASKVRVAAVVIEALSIVSEKSSEVRKCRDKWMASVVAYNQAEFEKVSNKTKESLIEESQKDVEQYEDKADLSIKTNDKEIKEADRLLATPLAPQQVQASGGSEVPDQWCHFKPKPNLAPTHLDQGVTHLTVSKLVDSMKTYIRVGFRGMVPPKGIWMYIAPFLASSWWASI